VIPLNVILIEFLLAFGAALFLANAVAIVRLRREQNWPPDRPAGVPADTAAQLTRAAAREQRVPSRARILAGLVIGLGVALWALATLAQRFSL
jgi:hypothetical protein